MNPKTIEEKLESHFRDITTAINQNDYAGVINHTYNVRVCYNNHGSKLEPKQKEHYSMIISGLEQYIESRWFRGVK